GEIGRRRDAVFELLQPRDDAVPARQRTACARPRLLRPRGLHPDQRPQPVEQKHGSDLLRRGRVDKSRARRAGSTVRTTIGGWPPERRNPKSETREWEGINRDQDAGAIRCEDPFAWVGITDTPTERLPSLGDIAKYVKGTIWGLSRRFCLF